jgi:branched-chain amino acid transport system ATP-binding protein
MGYSENLGESRILSGENIKKHFGGLVAVNDVNFQLYENEILGLIGPNGAGKTTLFNIIAGVFKADHGVIYLRGETISQLKAHQICKKGVARTFQIPLPFLSLNILENVLVGSYFGFHGKKHFEKCNDQAEELLCLVGLADKKKYLASRLNLNERKRLEIARAISTKPSVILLDEVVAGLNPKETLKMMELIQRIRDRGIAILMIEHVMKVVMEISNRIIVLQQGQKIAEGNSKEIANNQLVIEAYLGKGFKANA